VTVERWEVKKTSIIMRDGAAVAIVYEMENGDELGFPILGRFKEEKILPYSGSETWSDAERWKKERELVENNEELKVKG